MVSNKPSEIWRNLNERQQHYLRAAYDVDQQKEAYEKQMRAEGNYRRPPASEWRWMNYTPLTHNADLYNRIGRAHIDPGTGSTFEALETRGLIECRYEAAGAFDSPLLYVKITPLGRRVVRAALPADEQPRRKTKGVMSKWSWQALKVAYEAGEAGVTESRGWYGGIPWKTWLRLRDRKPGLVEEYVVSKGQIDSRGLRWGRKTTIRPTEAGRDFYEANLEKHRAAYPELYQGTEQDK